MSRRDKTPEEQERREKIKKLLQIANIGSIADIQNLFKKTIAEFMGNGQQTPIGAIFGLIAFILFVVSIIFSIVSDIQLFDLLF